MAQAQVPFETMEGYEPPFNTQFSIFLDNKVGKLLPLVELFDGKKIKLVALSVVDSADHSVVRIISSCADKVRKKLDDRHFAYSEAEIIVVELTQSGLSGLCKTLLSAEINIYYAYPLMVRPHGAATIALHTDNQYFAGQLLRKHQFTLLGEQDLGEPCE